MEKEKTIKGREGKRDERKPFSSKSNPLVFIFVKAEQKSDNFSL